MNTEQTQTKITLGEKIRNRRLQLGLSQQELVGDRYSGVYLSRVERDRMQPSDEFLAYLALRLGQTVAELTEDTVRVLSANKALSRQAQEAELQNANIAVQTNQPEKAMSHLGKFDADQLPRELQAPYYSILGEAKVGLRDFDDAQADLNKALQLLESNPQATALEVERVRNWIGLAYYRQGKHFLAIEHHQRCLKAIQEGKIDDARFKLKIYYNLGNEYYYIGNSQQALQLYKEAVKLAEEGEDSTDLAGIYWGIGLAYRSLDNLQMAKLYMDKSAGLFEQIGDLKQAVAVRNSLGQTLIERKEYDEAESRLNSAIAIGQQLEDDNSLAIGYCNLAYLYYEQQKLEQASQNIEISVQHAEKYNDLRLLGDVLAQDAEIKLAQGQSEEGINLFNRAVENLHQTDAKDRLAKVYFRYASGLEKLGKLQDAIQIYRKAYEYQKQGN